MRASKVFCVSAQANIQRVWISTLSNMEAHLEEQDDLEAFYLLPQTQLLFGLFPDYVFASASKKRGKVGRKKKYSPVRTILLLPLTCSSL